MTMTTAMALTPSDLFLFFFSVKLGDHLCFSFAMDPQVNWSGVWHQCLQCSDFLSLSQVGWVM